MFLCGHIFISLRYIPRYGMAGSYDNSMFNLLRNCCCSSEELHRFTFPLAVCEGSSFLHILPNNCYLSFIIGITVVSSGFDLHIPDV